MAIIQNNNQSTVIDSLDTYNCTVSSPGMYFIALNIFDQAGSLVVAQIQQNGLLMITSPSAGSPDGILNLQTVLNCATNDVISIVLTSGNAIDSAPNSIKGILNLHQGIS